MSDAVVSDPEIQGGVPCFRGTRVPVCSLFDHLAHDYTVEEFLQQFPTVSRGLVTKVLEDSSRLIQQSDQRTEPSHEASAR
jgi:uncharacterized protein (DUF433 family)